MVYIILVNYNGYLDTIECIASLLQIKYNDYKIVVVDNASNDAEKIRQDSFINANAHIIYSNENLGFSGGNNLGIDYALQNDADYVLLLNNDTIVDPLFLGELIKVIQTDAKIGITTGDIFYCSEPEKLWYSCGNYNRTTGITTMCVKCTENVREVNFACGCLALISINLIKSVGKLDESYFLYSEDTEYGCRATDNGWKIVWTRRAKIYHKISSSTVVNSNFQKYYLTRSNLYVAKKYCKRPIIAYLIRLVKELKRVIIDRISVKGITWAYIDFILGKTGRSPRF